MTAPSDATYCARHPQVETGLLCGRCGTPICPRCLVQSPVGSRCPDCAHISRIPTIDVSPMFILRGLAAAMAAGAGVGAVWGYVTGGAGGFGFFAIFLGIGIGWCVGEAISAATNRKRSPVLQGIAIAGCLLAYVVHNLVAGDAPLPTGDLWGYIVTGVAAVYAASRLSRGF